MRKIISISLIMGLIALFLLVSCDNQNNTNDGNNLSQNDEQQNIQEQEQEEDEPKENIKLEPNVPENLDLDGYQFRIIYNAKLNSPYEWGIDGIEAEEETGEPINDAAYQRNDFVTGKYNFEIAETKYGANDLTASVINRLVSSGADVNQRQAVRGVRRFYNYC